MSQITFNDMRKLDPWFGEKYQEDNWRGRLRMLRRIEGEDWLVRSLNSNTKIDRQTDLESH
ncbi:hypothetical protein BY996DRAFT_6481551 [Phakopsora pachyrhizi]|nr:hypothetical protein BY996DRAFT_6481551 [Phakopsora pachyrhizi]